MIHVSTGISDMRIVMKADETINSFLMLITTGLKWTHPQKTLPLFGRRRFIYANVPGQGWIKTKMANGRMIANVYQ